MDYKFPVINHLDDVLPYVKDHKEFIVAERDDFIVINYNIITPDTFGDHDEADFVRRECRGITFYKDGMIATRKLHKFFNVNERPETQFNVIDLEKPHIILEKLDGSMITPFSPEQDPLDINSDTLRWHTKMGDTDVASPVNDWIKKNQHYARYSAHIMANRLTPVYEWCSRKNRIVIDYPKDRLVLVAIRNNITGEYLSYDKLLIAKTHGIDVVQAYEATFDKDFLEEVQNMIGIEGFVVRFNNGHMLKIKSEDYLKLHKAKDAISQEKNVWSLILDQNVDDLKGFLLDDDRKRIEAFEVQLWDGVNNLIDMLNERMSFSNDRLDEIDYSVFNDPIHARKKEFALNYSQLSGDQLKPIMYRLYDGGDTREIVLNWIRSNLGTSTKLEKIRGLFNIHFNPGFVED